MSELNLIFHNIVETTVIAAAVGAFLLGWRHRNRLENNYLLVLGSALLCVGIAELAQTIAGYIPAEHGGFDRNRHIQLALAGRYIEVLSLLAAPFLMRVRLGFRRVVFLYAGITFSLIWVIMRTGLFPNCYVESSGLTNFVMDSEYLLSQLLAVSLGLLIWRYDRFRKRVLAALGVGILILMFSEVSFAHYLDRSLAPYVLGHIFLAGSCVVFWGAFMLAVRTAEETERDVCRPPRSESLGGDSADCSPFPNV